MTSLKSSQPKRLSSSKYDFQLALKNGWFFPALMSAILFFLYRYPILTLLYGNTDISFGTWAWGRGGASSRRSISYIADFAEPTSQPQRIRDLEYLFYRGEFEVVPIIIWAFVLGALAGFLAFSFLWSKKNVNFYLSKSVTRTQIVLNRSKAAAICFAVSTLLPIAILTGLNISRIGYSHNTLLVGLLLFLGIFTSCIVGFLFAALGSITAGNIIEAGIHASAFIFAPTVFFWGIEVLLKNFLRGAWSGNIGLIGDVYVGGTSIFFGPSKTDITSILMKTRFLNPIMLFSRGNMENNILNMLADRYISSTDPSTKANPIDFWAADLIPPILWLLLSVGVMYLGAYLLKNRLAQQAFTHGALRWATVFSGLTILSLFFVALVRESYGVNMAHIVGISLLVFTLVFLLYMLIFRRKPRESLRYLAYGAAIPLVFFLAGGVIYLGSWGYSNAIPPKDKIVNVRISAPVPEDQLFFVAANSATYPSYPDNLSANTETLFLKEQEEYNKASRTEKRQYNLTILSTSNNRLYHLAHERYTTERDIELVLTLLEKVQNQKFPATPWNMGYDEREFHFAFYLEDGSYFLRTFMLSESAVLEYLLEFYETDAVQERFRRSIDALFGIRRGPDMDLYSVGDGGRSHDDFEQILKKNRSALKEALLKDFEELGAENIRSLKENALARLALHYGESYYVPQYDENDNYIGEVLFSPDEEDYYDNYYHENNSYIFDGVYSRNSSVISIDILPSMKHTIAALGLKKPLMSNDRIVRAAYCKLKDLREHYYTYHIFNAWKLSSVYSYSISPYDDYGTVYRGDDPQPEHRLSRVFDRRSTNRNSIDVYNEVFAETSDKDEIAALLKRVRTTGIYRGEDLLLLEFDDGYVCAVVMVQ
ncbi:MAG: hypothetical protein FWG82_05315 [Oscillospiraceae bacterium]|nr:hypothetical protein [Oscillospiraceae bacterium]